jgi:aminopeptidase N
MEQFIVNNMQVSSFIIDASTKTRPMNAYPSVKTPAQISSLFDNISYKKGKSIVSLLAH